MSTYQRSWPLWTPEEDVMLVYYCDRGFEAVDVALIIACRLRRGVRTLRAIVNRMQWINRTRAQMGLRPLCTNDTADWDRVAVNNFIIHSAADSDSLQRLLWFHNQYIPLLRTWHDSNVPLNEVLNVGHLQRDLAGLVRMHRSIYGYPSWRYAGIRFH